MTEPTTTDAPTTQDPPDGVNPPGLNKEPPQQYMLGAPTGETRDAKAEDDLYVPVYNANYVPSGVTEPLQGFVPDTPGNDRTLNRMKEAMEGQGWKSGPDLDPLPKDADVEAFLGIPKPEEEGVESPTNAPVEETPPPDVPADPEPVAPTETDPNAPPEQPSQPLF